MTSSDQCKVLAYLLAISMSDDRVRPKYPFGYSIYYLQLYRRCQLFRIIGQGFADVFFLFPSPPQKRVKERVAAVARPRHSGNTLFIHLGWGACCPIRATFEKP